MSQVAISIIIATYNRSEKLKRALNSISAQSFRDFEVLVCDDGSIDDTEKTASEFKHLNLRYFKNENWGGPARPRNIGIQHAHGIWLCFLDSDDWWLPEKLSEVMKYSASFDVIYHSLGIIDGKGQNKGVLRARALGSRAFRDLMIKGNAIATSSVCLKADLIHQIGGFSEARQLIAVEDYELWLRISHKTNATFHHIDKKLGFYEINDGGITGRSYITIEQRLSAISKIYINELNVVDRKYHSGALSYQLTCAALRCNEVHQIIHINAIMAIKLGVIAIKCKAFLRYLLYFLGRTASNLGTVISL